MISVRLRYVLACIFVALMMGLQVDAHITGSSLEVIKGPSVAVSGYASPEPARSIAPVKVAQNTLAFNDSLQPFIDRTLIRMGDQWGNTFNCTFKLASENTGIYNGSFFKCNTYSVVIFYDGGGAGSYGDVIAHWEIFDARQLSGTPESGKVLWEFGRSGWGNYTIIIDDQTVAYFPALVDWSQQPYRWNANSTASYYEGIY